MYGFNPLGIHTIVGIVLRIGLQKVPISVVQGRCSSKSGGIVGNSRQDYDVGKEAKFGNIEYLSYHEY